MTAPGTMGQWWVDRETERARRHAAACRDACEGQDAPQISDLMVNINMETLKADAAMTKLERKHKDEPFYWIDWLFFAGMVACGVGFVGAAFLMIEVMARAIQMFADIWN